MAAHSQSIGVQFGNSTSARTLAWSSNVAAGALKVVGIITFGTNITVTVSDNLDGAYTQAGTYIVSGSRRLSIWYFPNATGGATTVTVTPSATAFISWDQTAYTAARTTAPLGDESGATGTGTTSSTGTITVAEPNMLIYAIVDVAGNGTVKTKDANYTERYNVLQSATVMGLLAQDHIGVSADEAATATHASVGWEAFGASFKSASGLLKTLQNELYVGNAA